MVYADYNFYKETYMGDMSEEEFAKTSIRASAFLDYYTMGKAEKNAELTGVKLACCALADQYKVIGLITAKVASESGEMQSQTVGSYSVTYRSGAEQMVAYKAELASIAKVYLSTTGLLYRGGGCECTLPTL